MIKADLIYETALDLLKKSVIEIPEDVYQAYQQAQGRETGMAREILSGHHSASTTPQ